VSAIAERWTASTIRSVTDTAGAWQRTVCDLGQSSLAHSPEWFTVIRDAYGHDPLYLSAEDEDGRPGLLPAFVVRRPLFGTVVTSMPFLDTGGPCSPSAALANLLVKGLIAEARRIGAHLVELRCTERLPLDVQPSQSKVNMTLPLPADAGRLWSKLDKSVRNQIRKAERSGLSIEFGGAQNLEAFYDTFVVRMRDLGSPVHGSGFLSAVLQSFGDRARVVLVRKGSTPVGGLIALAFKDRLAVPWATCLQDYFALCPNMLLYWETLRAACAEGYRRFDFGRSTRDSGTYRFKSQWGAHEEPLFWYDIPIGARHQAPAPSADRAAVLLSKMWQRMPLSLTRRLGPPIRKYLTQ
jgi:serine/alanine adding enzyme